MRHVIALAVLIAAPAAAQAPQAPWLERVEARVLFGVCAGRDPECADRRQQVHTLWPQALAGDYQAQRNVAHQLLAMRQPGTPREVVVAACAWRMVILASGHRQADISDIGNLRATCQQLGPRLIGAAPEVAAEGIMNDAMMHATQLLRARAARQG